MLLKENLSPYISAHLIGTFSYSTLGSGPQPFWPQGSILWKTIFAGVGAGGEGNGFGMIREHDIQAHFLLLCLVPNLLKTYWSLAQGLGPPARNYPHSYIFYSKSLESNQQKIEAYQSIYTKY